MIPQGGGVNPKMASGLIEAGERKEDHGVGPGLLAILDRWKDNLPSGRMTAHQEDRAGQRQGREAPERLTCSDLATSASNR